MTLGSLFDGIGGWPNAAISAGVKPVWASEIEPFPAAVTAHHYPGMKQLGDITKINVDELEPVDIICAGSPCQDLSVAGKRKGLAGERSGLFRTAIDIVHRLRERTGKPRFFVWENVPGAFSSNGGADFRAVLEEIGQTKIPMPARNKWATSGMVQCDQCEIAWRVLDAQYWGVPQRRKRIFLVADFAETDRRAAEILFVEQGVCGNPSAGEETREETTGGAEKGVNSAEHTYCLAGNTMDRHAVAKTYRQDAYDKFSEGDKASTLKASGGTYGGAVKTLYRSDVKTVGALMHRDYKGVGNQDFPKCDKLIVERRGISDDVQGYRESSE